MKIESPGTPMGEEDVLGLSNAEPTHLGSELSLFYEH
jgi:hypothetical protein